MQPLRKSTIKKLLRATVQSLYVLVIGVSVLVPAQPQIGKLLPSIAFAATSGPCQAQWFPTGTAQPQFSTGTYNADGQCDTPEGNFSSGDTFNSVVKPGTDKNSTGTPDAPKNDGLGCSLGTLDLCITNIVYGFTVGIMSVFAYVGGYVFSIAVQLSLNSVAYSLNFLSSGWAAVRDIANMSFIFILIYLAFTIMLGADTHGTNKTLATVVVMALLINFSFFITRVVIDGGNVLAVQFYNNIQAPAVANPGGGSGAVAASLQGTKDLTAGVMQVLEVTKLFDSPSFSTFYKTNHGLGGFMVVLITLSLIYIALGIIFGILASTFFFVGFKFLYRIIALWFVIIFAPLAFVARGLSNRSTQTFYKTWQNMLIQFAFYPAIFLFCFLLINYFINQMANGGFVVDQMFGDINSLTTGADNQGFLYLIGKVIGSIGIRLGLVIILLYFGLKIADMVVEQGSSTAEKVTGWAGRTLGGATYGALGYAGRNTIAVPARKYAPALQEKASSTTGFAKAPLLRGANWVNKKVALGSYDVRGVPRVQSTLLSTTRLDAGKASTSRRGLILGSVTDKSLSKIDRDTKSKIALAAKKQSSSLVESSKVAALTSAAVAASAPQTVNQAPEASAANQLPPNPPTFRVIQGGIGAAPQSTNAAPAPILPPPSTSFAAIPSAATPSSNTKQITPEAASWAEMGNASAAGVVSEAAARTPVGINPHHSSGSAPAHVDATHTTRGSTGIGPASSIPAASRAKQIADIMNREQAAANATNTQSLSQEPISAPTPGTLPPVQTAPGSAENEHSPEIHTTEANTTRGTSAPESAREELHIPPEPPRFIPTVGTNHLTKASVPPEQSKSAWAKAGEAVDHDRAETEKKTERLKKEEIQRLELKKDRKLREKVMKELQRVTKEWSQARGTAPGVAPSKTQEDTQSSSTSTDIEPEDTHESSGDAHTEHDSHGESPEHIG